MCAVEGYTYLISTLSGAGLAVTIALQFLLVRVTTPMDADEGYSLYLLYWYKSTHTDT